MHRQPPIKCRTREPSLSGSLRRIRQHPRVTRLVIKLSLGFPVKNGHFGLVEFGEVQSKWDPAKPGRVGEVISKWPLGLAGLMSSSRRPAHFPLGPDKLRRWFVSAGV